MDFGDWCIKQKLERRGLPWTRENFIAERWRGTDIPSPEDWDEEEVAADLRDWSKRGP